jgi:Zn/Cd-binding protein ZinT
MKLFFSRFALAAFAFAMAAFAAGVDGKWTAQIPGRNGQSREATFTFKADGDKLTGSMSGRQGDSPISDGKIAGDTITFTREGQRGKQTYTGKVSGDEIKFKVEGGQGGGGQEFTAKRAN